MNRWRPWIEKSEFVFQILFFFYVCLGFNNLTYATPVISVIMWPTYLLGAALLLIRLLNLKSYIKMPAILPLAGLCAVCAVSILLNRQYDIKKNIIYLIFWAFYFFMFYMHAADTDLTLLKKRFCILAHLFNGVAFVLAGVSLGMMGTGYSVVKTVAGGELHRGFVYGRLFGAYLTPNAGAIVGCIAIILSVYFISVYKKKLYTVAAAVNILVQFLYIVFSDSRSGRVCLALGGGAYILFRVLCSEKDKVTFKRATAGILATLIVTAGLFFAPKLAKTTYNAALTSIAQHRIEEEDPLSPDDPADTSDLPIIDRGYDMSGDISNRRFAIWGSGLEIFKKNVLFGTTFSGFLPYAKENLPDTYIVNNDYLDMETLDNDFMNLLVSDGALGFICFAVFVVWVLAYIFRYSLRDKTDGQTIAVLFAVCATAAAASMFSSGVLFMQCEYSILFWAALGLLVCFGEQQKKEGAHG